MERNMDESRKAFEHEFARLKGIPLSSVISARYKDTYWDEGCLNTTGISTAWKFWQASRAAIEIKLPPAMGAHQMQWDGTDWNQMREHAVNAFRAAGIKVKE